MNTQDNEIVTREVGNRYVFNYPDFGTPDGYPDHTAHRGQVVTVTEHSGRDAENEEECGERMYRVRADDGWEGYAWASELKEPN